MSYGNEISKSEAAGESSGSPHKGEQYQYQLKNGYLVTPESDTRPVLSVVMPTLNEEEGIIECIERVYHAIDELELPTEIIVSDSSTDRTPEIARKMGAHVITPEIGGYGAAYRAAFNHARGDYIAMGDADTTYDFEELPRLFEVVHRGDADMVMGSRFDGTIEPGAMPSLHQYVGNPLLTRFLNAFYDADVSDAHSGFRVFTRDAWERMDLQSTGMEFASEMIMDASVKDLRIEEVPITYHERTGEATLDSFQDGWRHVRFMLENAPGYMFTAPAIGFTVVGLATLLLSVIGVTYFDITFGTHTAIAGSLLTIVGHQVGSLALFSSIATNPIRAPADQVTATLRKHFRLEHGASIGLALFGVGALYVVAMFVRWVASGYTVLPAVVHNLFALTIIILGVQTVFSSFFLSMLAKSRLAS